MKTTVTGLVILLLTTMASASVLRIPADYPDIQSGIEHAATGDTVLLADMEFSGDGNCNIDFLGKSITVQSENGPDNCIINCGEHSRGFIFQTAETENAVLSGVTITGGFAAEDDLCRGGGGIVCIRNASPTIQQCNITNCKAQSGAGLYISHGSPVISNCTFDGNEAAWDGGGIYLSHGEPEITGCTFSNNKAITFSGGGIYIALANPDITDTSLFGNTAVNGAGIFATGYCEPTITQCTVHDNEAEAGGGIYACTVLGVINSTELYQNNAIYGAGIYLGFGTGIQVDGCNIHENKANWGGGLYVFIKASSKIKNSAISSNKSEHGGGIYCCSGSSPLILNNAIEQNLAGISGGAIYCEKFKHTEFPFPVIGNEPQSGNLFNENRAGVGADLYCGYSSVMILAGYNKFTGCLDSDYFVMNPQYFDLTGSTSQIIPITQDVYVSPDGSDLNDGLSASTPFKTIQHALKSVLGTDENPVTIRLAAGLYSYSNSGELYPLPLLSNITIVGADWNTSILDAEYTSRVATAVSCENTTVTNLLVTNGMANHGGGVYCLDADLELIRCKFISNSAVGVLDDKSYGYPVVPSATGGAIYSINSSLKVYRSCIYDNYAMHAGAGVCVTIKNGSSCSRAAEIGGSRDNKCYFSGNTAGYLGADIYYDSCVNVRLNATNNDFSGNLFSDYFVYSSNTVRLNACTPHEPVVITQDVYVKPDGNDSSDGLSWNTAFKTIRHAIENLDINQAPLRIYLGEGIYSPSTNGEIFPLPLIPEFILEGASKETTILDAEGTASVLYCHAFTTTDFTIRNITCTGGCSTIGGAIIADNARLNLDNCCILNNVALNIPHYLGLGGGIYSTDTTNITGCEISGNTAQHGGGIYALSFLHASNLEISHNQAVIAGGVFCYKGEITDSRFSNNSAHEGGAGYLLDRIYVNNSIIHQNTASSLGGGFIVQAERIFFNNCIFTDNYAEQGSALLCKIDKTQTQSYAFNNCTFTNNVAGDSGTLLFENDQYSYIRRSIIYNNQPDGIIAPDTVDVTYSDIQGGYSGSGNIDLDPKFVAGPLGSFYLANQETGQMVDSPCKNAGDIDASAVTYETDFATGIITMSDYTTRIDKVTDSGIVDIGYHYPPTGDIPTPTPTYPPTDTPTAIPTDTPTAIPTDTPTTAPTAVPSSTPLPGLGVKLKLSQHTFYPGDHFLLEAVLSNPGPETYQNLPLVILLDVYGSYFFYPNWTSAFDSEAADLGIEMVTLEIMKFDWPEVDGKSDDILFYGAFLNPGMTDILGSWDWISFQWGQR